MDRVLCLEILPLLLSKYIYFLVQKKKYIYFNLKRDFNLSWSLKMSQKPRSLLRRRFTVSHHVLHLLLNLVRGWTHNNKVFLSNNFVYVKDRYVFYYLTISGCKGMSPTEPSRIIYSPRSV